MRPLLTIGADAVSDTVTALSALGHGEVETAAFWLGGLRDLRVRTVVIPVGPEVSFQPLSIHISERWMMSLDRLCQQRDQIVLGGVHSHPDGAFFSGIDADGFFHAVDCVSVVLPSYAITNIAEATSTWAVLVGLPYNAWQPDRWDNAVGVESTGMHELIRLGERR